MVTQIPPWLQIIFASIENADQYLRNYMICVGGYPYKMRTLDLQNTAMRRLLKLIWM